jgi:hypothetical protein
MIINASFEIFTKNDFDKASTNMIVKKAGISRGLLYHYFEDKQDLFDFLIYYSKKIILDDLHKKIDWEERDVLKRIRQSVYIKFEILEAFPFMFEFFKKYSYRVNKYSDKEPLDEVSTNTKKKILTFNVDLDMFKNKKNIEKSISVILFTLEGIGKKHWEKYIDEEGIFDMTEIMDVCDEYLDYFREIFY